MAGRADLIHLLEVDPDLARDLSPEDARRARDHVVARVELVHAGQRADRWGPGDPSGHVGYMIVQGLMLREVVIGRSRCAELLGPPDLIRPWDHDGGVELPTGAEIVWEVFEDSKVALLDAGFVRRASAWPAVMSALAARGIWRAQSLAVHQAIGNLNRVDERILLLFWHLAQRWGRVRADGVLLEVPMTHDLVARLVAAQRPSVTTALGQLSRRELVRRLPDRRWLLPHGSLEHFEPLFDAVATA